MSDKAKLAYRITWSTDKRYFTFHLHAVDLFHALKKAHKRLERVGLLYYTVETITAVTGDIPF